MNSFSVIINIVITLIAYMTFPFYKFYLSKENYTLNFKKKVIFWNSIIGAILFTILRLIFNGFNNSTINFAPAFLYYIINRFLYTRKEENKEVCNDEPNKSINAMQNTINNTNKDLKTGVNKERLDELLKTGCITQEYYDELLENMYHNNEKE